MLKLATKIWKTVNTSDESTQSNIFNSEPMINVKDQI